ncbi:MAG: OmpA family protein [Bacillota bacterium]
MFANQLKYFLTAAVAIGFIGCASTPPNVQNISSSADPAYEISRTEDMVNEARQQQLDVLSPKNFKSAENALAKAKEYKAENKSTDKILEQVAYSRAWLAEGKSKAEIAIESIGDIRDARAGAMKAQANTLFPKEWDKAGKELEHITKDIENGSLKSADKKGTDIVAKYRQLERDAVSATYLGKADANISDAKKKGADIKAPKTYGVAKMRYNETEKIIAKDPRNTDLISRSAQIANRESYHLTEVLAKVNAGNTEDLVLQSEHQQRTISGLKSETAYKERALQKTEGELSEAQKQAAELQKTQALLDTASKIRSQFKPNEAEVFTENGKVMVRLKALTFPSGQATLGAKNKEFLKRVETALSDIPTSNISVEGHTDSTGSANTNMRISEMRAKAVQDQLIANGAASEKVNAVGMGDEKPISNNTTATGRAQNRRIDLVIEPKIE